MNNLSNHEFKNVLDFQAAKNIKASTGQAKAVRQNTPESPSFEKHANEAIAMGNPVQKKQTLADKYYSKMGKFLGLE